MTTSKIALVTFALLLSTVTSYAQHCNDAADCAMWDRMDAFIHRDDRKPGRYDACRSRRSLPGLAARGRLHSVFSNPLLELIEDADGRIIR
jgi:hypothetical protein